MRIRKTLLISLFFYLLQSQASRADIFETKNEGYVNGELVSEDENSIEIKDSYGVVRRLSKKNLISIVPEVKAQATPQSDSKKEVLLSHKNWWLDRWGAVKVFCANPIDKVKPWLKKLTLGQYLQLDKKVVFKESEESKQLNKTLDEANQAADAAFKQQREANRRMRQAQAEQ